MILTVIAKPGAKETKITAWRDEGTICIDVSAPPIDGKANRELIKFLAKALKIPQTFITIKRGQGSKVKHIELPAGTDLGPINPAV